jgi:hypothetical protein
MPLWKNDSLLLVCGPLLRMASTSPFIFVLYMFYFKVICYEFSTMVSFQVCCSLICHLGMVTLWLMRASSWIIVHTWVVHIAAGWSGLHLPMAVVDEASGAGCIPRLLSVVVLHGCTSINRVVSNVSKATLTMRKKYCRSLHDIIWVKTCSTFFPQCCHVMRCSCACDMYVWSNCDNFLKRPRSTSQSSSITLMAEF